MTPARTSAQRPELRSLTALRFFAALAVVLFHFGRHATGDWPEVLRRLIAHGFFGVTLFFVLSGFILVYVCDGRPLSTAAERRDFYLRRFARIYPVYFAAWALAGTVMLAHWAMAGTSLGYIVKASVFYGGLSAVLLQAWVPDAAYVWNTPAWSLSVEAFFYAGFPFVFPLLARWPARRLWLALGVLASIAAAMAIAQSPVLEAAARAEPAHRDWWHDLLAAYPVFHVPAFLIGMVLGLLYRRGGVPRLVLERAPAVAVAATAFTVALLALPIPDAALRAILPLAFGFCILGLALAASEPALPATTPMGRLGACLGDGIVHLGRASYATYILQNPLWHWWCLATGAPATAEQPGAFVAAFVLFLLLASVLAYHAVERPLEAALKRRFAAGPSTTAPARTVIQ